MQSALLLAGAEERAMHDTAPNSDQEDTDSQDEAAANDVCLNEKQESNDSPRPVDENVPMDAEPMEQHCSAGAAGQVS